MEAARLADAGDLEAMAHLAEQAVEELAPLRGGSVWARREARRPPYSDSLAESQADDAQLVVVGTVHDSVVGYAVVRLDPLQDGSLLAIVDDLYVEGRARGIGVGEAMMDILVGWAEERGAVGLDGFALPGHRDTKNFFETFGLTARGIIVHRPLGGGGGGSPG